MHTITDHLTSGVAVIVASIFGGKAGLVLADATSDALNGALPPWLAQLYGPFGAVLALVVGLRWMNQRLTAAETKADENERRAEEKADKREIERDADRKTLITVIEQNSQVLREVKTHLDK